MPTGGVSPTEENLKEWITAGVHCVGIGSKLFIKNDAGTFDYEKVKLKVAEAISIVKTLRP
ncbi:keto-hydroxyglutarate-aldolase/keto-deoxy-phosphogluconate aldolase [Zunongwangia atlantica 22II14-10F7]|uniref:Keto-hydroxyglutarate-aldolase/keto-deoxy-phosphogluconate aldolase n=2 Tax=Zunongwangia TaxID=417127 RepID=A0A1Y1T354_9FLAO|nr:keto-hydroxyglutarate-aldolase/keto-deoxy-phosphogluconate aldolase [Zunongwangia atlantica 22II14-10F7]